MPTGYTSQITDQTTLKDFTLICARAMGACVMMRDDPMSAEIPEKFEPSSYYATSLLGKQIELSKLDAMTPEEVEQAAEADWQSKIDRANEWQAERVALRSRYQRVRDEVAQWVPPSPDHVGLKNFMLQQIDDSIDWDCTPVDLPTGKLSGEAWRTAEREKLVRDIAYSEKAMAEEIERTNSRNVWLKQLRDSLQEVSV